MFSVVGALEDDFGFADLELVAFASHGFEEDPEVHHAPAADFELVAAVAAFDLEGDVGLELFLEAVVDLA